MTPPVKTPSLNPVSLKERMKMPRQHMLEQPAHVRATNFTEVNLGYSSELADKTPENNNIVRERT